MKKGTVIIKSIVIAPLLLIMINIGDLKCQETKNSINAAYQSKEMARTAGGIDEDDTKNHKNDGVKILEFIIERNLFYLYKTIDTEELENRVEQRK